MDQRGSREPVRRHRDESGLDIEATADRVARWARIAAVRASADRVPTQRESAPAS